MSLLIYFQVPWRAKSAYRVEADDLLHRAAEQLVLGRADLQGCHAVAEYQASQPTYKQYLCAIFGRSRTERGQPQSGAGPTDRDRLFVLAQQISSATRISLLAAAASIRLRGACERPEMISRDECDVHARFYNRSLKDSRPGRAFVEGGTSEQPLLVAVHHEPLDRSRVSSKCVCDRAFHTIMIDLI